MLKLADVAPIPIASEPTATSVNPGFLRKIRTAWRKDLSISGSFRAHVRASCALAEGTLHTIRAQSIDTQITRVGEAGGARTCAPLFIPGIGLFGFSPGTIRDLRLEILSVT